MGEMAAPFSVAGEVFIGLLLSFSVFFWVSGLEGYRSRFGTWVTALSLRSI